MAHLLLEVIRERGIRMTILRMFAGLLMASVLSSAHVFAQAGDVTTATDARPSIREYVASADFGHVVITASKAPAFQSTGTGRQRSTTRKVIGTIVGGVGGFFGGGFLGAAIEGDRCDCDDPGFVGFLIGAPTGAAVGAILGYKFF
jgi:hypothetical protein